MEDKQSWNNFIINNSSPSSFLQSWEWGEFQEALGNKIYRVEIEDAIKFLIIVRELPLGRTYLEIPKGPVGDESGISNLELWKEFTDKLKEIGKKEKAVLVRINLPYPNLQLTTYNLQRPEILLRQTEPEDTVLVDLSKSEDELMQNMHEKSRYNIRLAQKKGVKVRVATQDKTAFEKFLELLQETTKRDGITSWPNERFRRFRDFFMISSPDEGRVAEGREGLIPHSELLIGELDGQILAAAIIMLFGDSGTYLYAASSAENRPANAPSLVLWEAIKLAKARGKRWYDMWGIAPSAEADGEDHPWAGITRFKSRYIKPGVTGKEVRNIGTRDLVLDEKFYRIFTFGKKIFK